MSSELRRAGRYRQVSSKADDNGAFAGRDDIRGDELWIREVSATLAEDLEKGRYVTHGCIEPVLDVLPGPLTDRSPDDPGESMLWVIESKPKLPRLPEVLHKITPYLALQVLHGRGLIEQAFVAARAPAPTFDPNWIYLSTVPTFGGLVARPTPALTRSAMAQLLIEALPSEERTGRVASHLKQTFCEHASVDAETPTDFVSRVEETARQLDLELLIDDKPLLPSQPNQAARGMPTWVVFLLPPMGFLLWLWLTHRL